MAIKKQTPTKKAIPRQPLHKHIVSSLTATAEHKHTGKRLHSKHTSHGFLLALLVLTGVLLFSNLGALKAYGVTQGGNVNVSVNIFGDPPTEGAVIVFPETNTQTNSALLEVSGTCPEQTLVSVYNNGTFAGSTVCSAEATFAVVITLTPGNNILQAQNYDGMNQPGPVTAQHLVFYEVLPIPTDEKPTVGKPTILPPIANPVVPQPQAPQPGSSCYDSLKTQSEAIGASITPVISINCVHRNIYPGEKFTISFLINNGTPPYALNIDWDDGNNDLLSITNNEMQTVSYSYARPGAYTITLYTTDSAGEKSQIQTVVSVDGEPTAAANPVDGIVRDIQTVWLESPIPLYIAAVTLALGFWVGDVFQRFITSQTTTHKSKKRHA